MSESRNDRNPLIIVGASARSAAQIAVAARFDVLAWDLFADQDLAAVADAHLVDADAYPGLLPEVLETIPGDVPCMYTGGLENHPTILERIATKRPLMGTHGDSLRTVRDRNWLAETAQAAGWRMPELASRKRPMERIVERPKTHCGGTGLQLWKAGAPSSSSAHFEEFVAGDAYGAVFIAGAQDASLLGVTRQRVARDFDRHVLRSVHPFAYVGSAGPVALPDADCVALVRLGTQLVDAAQLRGLFGIDAIRTRTGEWVLIEVNPRFTASIEVLQRFASWNAVQLHVDAWDSGRVPRVKTPHGACIEKRIVYADADYRIDSAVSQLMMQWNTDRNRLADIPTAGQVIMQGRPLATVFGSGRCIEDARADADAAERSLLDAILRLASYSSSSSRRRAVSRIFSRE